MCCSRNGCTKLRSALTRHPILSQVPSWPLTLHWVWYCLIHGHEKKKELILARHHYPNTSMLFHVCAATFDSLPGDSSLDIARILAPKIFTSFFRHNSLCAILGTFSACVISVRNISRRRRQVRQVAGAGIGYYAGILRSDITRVILRG